jgi:hypothetical protein
MTRLTGPPYKVAPPNQRLLLPGRERLRRRAISFELGPRRLRHAPQQKRRSLGHTEKSGESIDP